LHLMWSQNCDDCGPERLVLWVATLMYDDLSTTLVLIVISSITISFAALQSAQENNNLQASPQCERLLYLKQ
jgi:hypothetical protein